MIWITTGSVFTIVVTIVTLWLGFRNINSLWVFGPVYWIVRDIEPNKKSPLVSIGFMRQTTRPWNTGRGIQVQSKKYSYQIGVCRKSPPMDDQSGLLFAVQGRILETPSTEIGEWK